MIEIDTSELVDYARSLRARGPRIARRHVEGAVHAAGDAVGRQSMAGAPVRTGSLRQSIRVDHAGSKVTVVAGAKYSGHVEFGTDRMAPRPFMSEAFDSHMPVVDRDLERACQQATEDLARL